MQSEETTITPDDLRGWRIAAALTQEGAARELGVPLNTYIRWERGIGVRHPRLLALALAAIHEGMPPWETPPDLAADRPRRGRPRKRAIVV